MKFIVLFCFFVSACLALENSVHKMNENETSRKFRTAKVNQLWDKAIKLKLSSVILSDLYVDLKHHDRQLMDAKVSQIDAENQIWEVLKEDFTRIMVRYGLAGSRSLDENTTGQQKSKQPFQDPQLNKLWLNTAASKKFKNEEMEKLFIEFKHHEDKIWELNSLHKDLEKMKAISENSVERFLDSDEEKKKEKYVEELQQELENSFERLHRVTLKSTDEKVDFIEPRVAELWEMARNGNFSEDGLASVRQELHHFENRITKHRHFREQLKNSAEKLDFHGGESAPDDRVVKHQKLQDKVQDLGNKVKKLFGSLKSRLSNGVITHKEL
nr:alpha-2-macroglobulin receptor-associated protein-like [Ciona intestinalis]|eukprot:XP_002127747.1 alpha-2-macroglobulin receptor-associated protein-like [Ciona intestinalis]